MKTGRVSRLGFFLVVFLTALFFSGYSQTIVKGFVRDAITKKPMSLVTVYFKDGKGVSTGDDGSYSIQTINSKRTTLIFSYVGYKTASKSVQPNVEQTINVDMELSAAMKEVVVKRGKGKYRNKNNPAVQLIDKVIENKENNRLTAHDYVQYQQYEKLGLSLSNQPEKLMKNRLFKNYKFIMENLDTTTVEGKALLPIYLEEKLSEHYFRKNPKEDKTIIQGQKKVNYGDFLDNAGISTYLNKLYSDIDIYDNNINILNSQFLSPIANIGPTFYRYYIRDTSVVDGIKLIRLYFTPKNPNDLLFRGIMYITLDSNYGVQKIDMTISKKANLNWTRELRVRQDFERGNDGRYSMIKSDMLAEFAIVNNSSGGLFGERIVSYKNMAYDTPAPDSIYKAKDLVDLSGGVLNNSDSFWIANRHVPLSSVEAKTYYNIDSLRNLKSFKTFATIFTAIFSGYIVLDKYEIGNTNTFYSFNPVEGFRLRAGGRTTPKFSNRLYFENYLAYGFKDEQFKYLFGTTYSFNGKTIYAYPLNYLKASYQYDMKIPGQELQFVQEDNFFLSFKRGKNDKWVYNNVFKLEYVHEFGKNISYTFQFNNTKQTPAGAIVYQKQDGVNGSIVPNLTTSELSAELRWAPNEQFYQGKNYRIPIFNKYPIFKLKYIAGLKGVLKSDYHYNKLNLTIDKRCYMSQLGYTDVTLEGGYIFGQVPFPLLTAHRANQTYGYQYYSYNLMNFLEFVSDKFAAATFDVHFNGFFLNKIPVLKNLKLREVASAKILYGAVSDKNNPALTNAVYKFPQNSETGMPSTFTLNNKPYVEVSVGIANIFKIMRVDLVKRLTYLENPDVLSWGIRTRFKFDF